MTAETRTLVSFVIPVLNERENIPLLISRIVLIMKSVKDRYDFEIIFTDNHSSDGTFDEIVAQGLKYPDISIRVVRFSKNIGYQLSILRGYRMAEGNCAIQLDGDLQDPPEMAVEFLKKWEEGYKVVYGIRNRRVESPLRTTARKLFYRLVNKVGDDDIPVDAGDFRLIDRKILDQLDLIKGREIYLRGLIASLGFNQIGIEYDRPARERGDTKFGNFDLIRLGLSGIFGHSDLPLRIARYLSTLVSLITFLLAIAYVVGKLVYTDMILRGFTTTTVFILLSLSIVTFILSILGEYLMRIFRILNTTDQGIIELESTNQ